MSILKDFDELKPRMERLSSKLEILLGDILTSAAIRVHSVTTRVKDRTSLEKKISRDVAKPYDSIDQITDVCGARIIAYFFDDVDKIAELVEREFEIDSPNSVDKRRQEDFDRFGYSSLHYVVSLRPSRTVLPEYGGFEKLKFEIQIRSILQHAWAEIEHDLQYKSELEIPVEVRRRFARLAGLLELADTEFTGLRDQLVNYRTRIETAVKTGVGTVLVDRDSLAQLVGQSELVSKLDGEIAALLGAPLDGSIAVDITGALLNALGQRSIAAVESTLLVNAERVIRFAKAFLDRDEGANRSRTPARGISIGYLAYVLLAQLRSESDARRVLADAKLPEYVLSSLNHGLGPIMEAYRKSENAAS